MKVQALMLSLQMALNAETLIVKADVIYENQVYFKTNPVS